MKMAMTFPTGSQASVSELAGAVKKFRFIEAPTNADLLCAIRFISLRAFVGATEFAQYSTSERESEF